MVCNCFYLCLSLSLPLTPSLCLCIYRWGWGTGELFIRRTAIVLCLFHDLTRYCITLTCTDMYWHALTCTDMYWRVQVNMCTARNNYTNNIVSVYQQNRVSEYWPDIVEGRTICTVVTATSDISCTCSCHLFLWARNLIILMFLEEFGSSYETIASCFFVFNLNLLWVAIPLYCPGVGCNSINYPLWGITTHCEA